jgi:hypothetical protein
MLAWYVNPYFVRVNGMVVFESGVLTSLWHEDVHDSTASGDEHTHSGDRDLQVDHLYLRERSEQSGAHVFRPCPSSR